ncbi:hypothetical protein B0H16DRAFT_1450983 [Mycena metata]|uniref:Uncharacterized protein n=1 Tax=Mycena metata TaxID=1033252 RepID=A0AAD7NSJ0_9AGAR|nr:hypothetical protein B0H16DRAFT_1450983 [Mycena metata]
MGRKMFGFLLDQERESYRATLGPTRHPRSYPLRALAQTLAAAESRQRRSMHRERGSGVPVPMLSVLGATGFRSQSPTITEPAERIRSPISSSFRSSSVSATEPVDRMRTPEITYAVGDGGIPDIHLDYRGRRLVEVVMADIAGFSEGPTAFRYAVTDPNRGPCLREDDDVLLIGMLHHPARVFKNHGVAYERPLCTVVECLLNSDRSSVVLLVPNYLIHLDFAAESEPNTLYTGAAVGVQIFTLPHMNEIDWIPGNPIGTYQTSAVSSL